MKIGQNGINLLKTLEGCSSKIKGKNIILNEQDIKNNILVYPYLCSANHLTIGFGLTVQVAKKYAKDNFDLGISVARCDELFRLALPEYENNINNLLKIEVSQNQFDALVCLCFNLGAGMAKIIIDFINAGNFAEVRRFWLKKLCYESGNKRTKAEAIRLTKKEIKEGKIIEDFDYRVLQWQDGLNLGLEARRAIEFELFIKD